MSYETQMIISIDIDKLIGSVERYRNDGYRLVQINCTKIGEVFEINYSFDRDYHLENIRITVKADAEIPSISGMYWNSFIYENEMHDLFGIQVRGMNIDFKGTLFQTAVKFPFSIAPETPVKGEKP